MKEVVDTILRAEEEAKNRIAEAREQAKKLAADADVQARQLGESERGAAHERAKQLVESAISEAKAERASKLEATQTTVGSLKDAKSDAMRRAVEKAAERLTRVERA
jgi:vacuolar-type H+-ATPase subunit H